VQLKHPRKFIEWIYFVVFFCVQDGSVVHFKIKRNTPLKKLMQAYCDRQVSCSGG